MDGYKESADLLVETAIASQDIRMLDTFVYPILFSYRQYLELEMEWLVLTYSRLDREEKRQFIRSANHDLLSTWNRLKPFLLEDVDEKEVQDVRNVESYIKQFNELDESSFTFRYPIGKDLDRLVTKEHRIDLKVLKRRMQELSCFFNGVEGFLDQKQEYENELSQYLE